MRFPFVLVADRHHMEEQGEWRSGTGQGRGELLSLAMSVLRATTRGNEEEGSMERKRGGVDLGLDRGLLGLGEVGPIWVGCWALSLLF